MVSLETEHSESISAEAIPRHLRATLSCLALLVASNSHRMRMRSSIRVKVDERGKVRSKKRLWLPAPAPRPTRSYIIFYDGIVSCRLYRFTCNSLQSSLTESPLANFATPYTSYSGPFYYRYIEYPVLSKSFFFFFPGIGR